MSIKLNANILVDKIIVCVISISSVVFCLSTDWWQDNKQAHCSNAGGLLSTFIYHG